VPEAVGPIVDRLWLGVDVRLADGVEPDLDACEADLDRLIANRIISAVRFQCYTGDALIYERAFVFARQPLEPGGSEVDPSLDSLPDDARFRVVVTPNSDIPEESRQAWFDQLGWYAAAPLRKPPGVVPQTYLTTVHDEYASDSDAAVIRAASAVDQSALRGGHRVDRRRSGPSRGSGNAREPCVGADKRKLICHARRNVTAMGHPRAWNAW
jgi:hypothetical protein